PLFAIMFALNDGQDGTPALAGGRLEPRPLNTDSAKFDLDVALMRTGGRIEGVLTYATDLLDSGTVERLAERYRRVLEQVAAEPRRRLSDLRLLDPGEERELVSLHHATAAGWPAGTLPELVAAPAAPT